MRNTGEYVCVISQSLLGLMAIICHIILFIQTNINSYLIILNISVYLCPFIYGLQNKDMFFKAVVYSNGSGNE